MPAPWVSVRTTSFVCVHVRAREKGGGLIISLVTADQNELVFFIFFIYIMTCFSSFLQYVSFKSIDS